jgi:hypothetical protein
VFGKDSAGGDDGAFADAAVVEDRNAHADEDGIFHNTAVNGGVVADGDPVADGDGVEIALAMEHAAVLHVGVGADLDGVNVPAEDGVHPDRGVFAEGDIAEELGGEIDVAAIGNARRVALVTANHGKLDLKGQSKTWDEALHHCRSTVELGLVGGVVGESQVF